MARRSNALSFCGGFTGICLVLAGCGAEVSTSRLSGSDASRGNDATQSIDPDQPTYVRVAQSLVTREFVARRGFIRDHGRSAEFALGWLPGSQYADLRDEGADVVKLDEKRFAREAFDLRTLMPLDTDRFAESETVRERGTLAEDYHNYEKLTTELKNLADSAPDLVRLESAGRSTNGRELWVARVGNFAAAAASGESEPAGPKLLYIANMHGDETVGRELMIYLLRKLVREYDSAPRIRDLVDHSQIFIMPSMNPDGFEAGQRWNARTRDLNRNFPDFTSDPRDIPGNREAETKAVMALHGAHDFTLAMNHHGGDVCFNMPWDTTANDDARTKFGDDRLIRTLGREYADANPTMRANNSSGFDDGLTYGYEWYEVDGGMQDWSIFYRNSTHATLELSYTKYPPAAQLPRFWAENEAPLIRYLERGQTGVHLEVVDSEGRGVINPSVSVTGSTRAVAFRTSKVHRIALAGQVNATVSAPGFAPVTVATTAAPFRGTYERIVLSRSAAR